MWLVYKLQHIRLKFVYISTMDPFESLFSNTVGSLLMVSHPAPHPRIFSSSVKILFSTFCGALFFDIKLKGRLCIWSS